MAVNTKKFDPNSVFPLVQWYGKCLEYLRQILHREDIIIKENIFEQAQVDKLFIYREQREFMEVELENLTVGLYKEYGFRIPNINGWRINKNHPFNKSRSTFTAMSAKSAYHQRPLYPSLVTDALLALLKPQN